MSIHTHPCVRNVPEEIRGVKLYHPTFQSFVHQFFLVHAREPTDERVQVKTNHRVLVPPVSSKPYCVL